MTFPDHRIYYTLPSQLRTRLKDYIVLQRLNTNSRNNNDVLLYIVLYINRQHQDDNSDALYLYVGVMQEVYTSNKLKDNTNNLNGIFLNEQRTTAPETEVKF